MSNDPDFEKRINNQLATIAENQARNDSEITRILEAVSGMIKVARPHNERLDRIERQTEENSRLIAGQRESINALIRIVEGHVTNHP